MSPTPAILTLADLVDRLDGIDPNSLTYQQGRGWTIGFTDCSDFESACLAFPGQPADRVDHNLVAKRFLVTGHHDFELDHACHPQLGCWATHTMVETARRFGAGTLDDAHLEDRTLLRALREAVDVLPAASAARLVDVYCVARGVSRAEGLADLLGEDSATDPSRHDELLHAQTSPAMAA